MQAFQRPPGPQTPQAPPPPPNPALVEQSRQEGKMEARQAQGRASTILTKPADDLGVINKKAPSLAM
jgi:hypothetical protein